MNACGRPVDFTWHLRDKQHLPTGGELAAYLAEEFEAPQELAQTGDLTRVSQFIDSVESSGGELYQVLHDIFDADYEPGTCAPFSRSDGAAPPGAQSAPSDSDHELRRCARTCLRASGQAYDLITYIASSPKEYRGRFMHWAPGEPAPPPQVIESANDYRLGPEKRTVILKLHGAVQRLRPPEEDNYVITRTHIEYLTHTDMTSQLPSVVTDKMRNSSYVFLGYGMKD